MSEKITVEIELEDAGYLYHTGSKSFYHKPEQEGRFLPIGIGKCKNDILEITQNEETDKECSMYWCNTFLEASIWVQALKQKGFKAMLLSDETLYADGSWAVLSNKPMKFSTDK
jgi:hypothetical protein